MKSQIKCIYEMSLSILANMVHNYMLVLIFALLIKQVRYLFWSKYIRCPSASMSLLSKTFLIFIFFLQSNITYYKSLFPKGDSFFFLKKDPGISWKGR